MAWKGERLRIGERLGDSVLPSVLWEWPQRSSSLSLLYNSKGKRQKVKPKSQWQKRPLKPQLQSPSPVLFLPHCLSSFSTCSILLISSWDKTWTTSKLPRCPLIGITNLYQWACKCHSEDRGGGWYEQQAVLAPKFPFGKKKRQAFLSIPAVPAFSQHHSS